MFFNVFAHNRDDHSNNFNFLCDSRKWRLAPAYDLTYSSSIGGEHATNIAGEGRSLGMGDILKVARKAGMKESKAGRSPRKCRRQSAHSCLPTYDLSRRENILSQETTEWGRGC